ncbi:uncharacterized protein LOC118356048 isoform X1 [Zalophus californianus]|uniref:Uncharacterized protein LOC118356048 isoform X1 n=1 Tax=Zalophus californianus TaxID=9704 RepID=A0A6P9EUN3_ZALCA|nr:uncharacterized protein LOC118356048 isoform X1 [Zalophus californianus]XP_035578433.1 uncharacterized protein LOC118356048 isoform X1 [Zalophus californianus]XP_035578434.1 uncharacterized protein LOC118356048 isoform X1 [Zalophus californianus]XP_035578435.1 uncharacterized protein LOC118356048 isoform X1 [Zalophus californianus]
MCDQDSGMPGATVGTAQHTGTDEALGPEPNPTGSPWKSVLCEDKTAPCPAHFVGDPQTKMFTCCLPKSRGCRLKKARPADAVPRWGFCVRAPHRLWPFGQKDRKKSMDDMERWLVDTPSISWTEGLTPQGSLGAGAGDCQRRPPTPPRPLSQVVVHRTVVQELEPTEAEPEAAPPPEELEPAPTPSTALEGRGSDCSDFRRRPGAGR